MKFCYRANLLLLQGRHKVCSKAMAENNSFKIKVILLSCTVFSKDYYILHQL